MTDSLRLSQLERELLELASNAPLMGVSTSGCVDIHSERCRWAQGGVVQTEKDAEIVDWVGRLGAAGAEHVMARFAMGRSWAYARLSRLVEDSTGALPPAWVLRRPDRRASVAGLQRFGAHRQPVSAVARPLWNERRAPERL